MDATRLLGGLLHQRAEINPHASRTLGAALHGPPAGYAPPPGAGGLEGMLGGVLREALGRAGRPAPAHFPHVERWPAAGHGQHHHHYHAHNELDARSAHLVRAMISAAAADGRLDPAEQNAVVSQLGYLAPDEQQFLRQEFARPLDPHTIAVNTPPGMQAEVYAVSLMAICLDTQPEARHLAQLAECLGLPPQVCNQIHHRMGAPCIFP